MSGGDSGSFSASLQEKLSLSCEASEEGLRCDQTVPISVKVKLGDIDPKPPLPPPHHDFSGCIDASSSPSWKLQDGLYLLSINDPASTDVSFSKTSRIHFMLTNMANNYSVVCEARSAYADSSSQINDPLWYRCDPVKQNTYPKYAISTNFQYSPTKQQLYLNQSWFCDDNGPEHP
jgi:hypothetical protein